MKRSIVRRLLATTVVASGLLAAGRAEAAVDMFLKIDGIVGESTDKQHAGEMDVLAWSWGESTGTARTRHGVGPVSCITDLSLTKFVDSASPALIMDGMTGKISQTAVLTVRKAGERPVEYFTLTMKNVTISSYQTGGYGGEDRLTENIVLHFSSLHGEYHPQKPDGTQGPAITFDITENSVACR